MEFNLLKAKDETMYTVDFYYGDYKQTVQFLNIVEAEAFFEDISKHANEVVLTQHSKIKRMVSESKLCYDLVVNSPKASEKKNIDLNSEVIEGEVNLPNYEKRLSKLEEKLDQYEKLKGSDGTVDLLEGIVKYFENWMQQQEDKEEARRMYEGI